MTAQDAAQLRELASAVQRLVPDRHDPEAFFVNRSEIAAQLRKLAQSPSEHIRQRSAACAK